MEKYSVAYDDELTKVSEVGKKGTFCPDCKQRIFQDKYCNNCGTKPFEKRPDSTKEK